MSKLTKDPNEGLLKALMCPCCQEYMIPPIYFCENGHNICKNCKPIKLRCPDCRQPYLRTRNFALGNICKQVDFFNSIFFLIYWQHAPLQLWILHAIRIKIWITFISRFHRRSFQFVVFISVGLSSICWHILQVLLSVEISSVAWPEQSIVNCPVQMTEETSTPNKTCRRCKKDEKPTETNTTNWIGRR